MSGDIHKYPAGTLINFTSDEHSDFSNVMLVRALVDLSLYDLEAEFKAEFNASEEFLALGPDKFAAWLVKTGKVEAVDSSEVHLGSYGCLEL